jgi:site-specific recombinase XerD
MKLADVAAEYIAFKQSLGMRFRSEAVILKAVSRALGDIEMIATQPGDVLAYIDGAGPLTTFWHRKFEALTGFYQFAINRGYTTFSPLPTTIPKRPMSFVPYIYDSEEMRSLLAATKGLEKQSRNLLEGTFHTLLLLLYGTGLRISEALMLRLADVDLPANLLTIHESKFFKSRLVPIGPQLSEILSAYLRKRPIWPRPEGKQSAFLPTRNGKVFTRGYAENNFRNLCNQAGIRREDGARYQPRLHDIRHTFAVTRLVTWYREGADVQRLLPQLSAYLGHISINATQRYLSMTPELLREASKRFEHYVFREVNNA